MIRSWMALHKLLLYAGELSRLAGCGRQQVPVVLYQVPGEVIPKKKGTAQQLTACTDCCKRALQSTMYLSQKTECTLSKGHTR